VSQQMTINKLDKDNTSYRCCPSCSSIGRPAMTAGMFECLQCGLTYWGYKVYNLELAQREKLSSDTKS